MRSGRRGDLCLDWPAAPPASFHRPTRSSVALGVIADPVLCIQPRQYRASRYLTGKQCPGFFQSVVGFGQLFTMYLLYVYGRDYEGLYILQ